MAVLPGPHRHYTPRSENRQAANPRENDLWPNGQDSPKEVQKRGRPRRLGFAALRCLHFLFIEPGYGADIRTTAQCLVQASDVQRRGVAHEHLTGKIKTEPAMLQASLDDATLKDGTFASACRAELVAATTAETFLVGIARTAVAAADRCNPAFQAFAIAHIRTLISMPLRTRANTSTGGPTGSSDLPPL
jgi:hypothetical protein